MNELPKKMVTKPGKTRATWSCAIVAFVLLAGVFAYHEPQKETTKSAALISKVVIPKAIKPVFVDHTMDGAAPPTWLGDSDIYAAVFAAKDLHLSPEQMREVQAKYDSFLDQVKQLEARIAQKEMTKPDEALITIPAHQAGEQVLYSSFENEVIAYLGANDAETLLKECQPTLARLNADFGSNEQLILVDRANGMYHIVQKDTYDSRPDLPAGVVSNGGTTRTMISDLAVGGNMAIYRYLAPEFP